MNRNNIRTIACCLVWAAVSLSPAYAQTASKAETKLYNKTISKATVAAYDKFLTKYPSSTYALEVQTLRDSVLFSEVDKEDAVAVDAFIHAHPSSPLMDELKALLSKLETCPLDGAAAERVAASSSIAFDPSHMLAAAYRSLNRDYVCVVDLMPAEAPFSQMVLTMIECEGGKSDAAGAGKWSIKETRMLEKYSLDPSMDRTIPDSGLSVVEVSGSKALKLDYLNSSSASDMNLEWCSSLIPLDGGAQTNAMFYGRNMSGKPASAGSYSIEGRSPEALSVTGLTPELSLLLQGMNHNASLKQISKADEMSDDAIAWWLDKNPKAQSTATSVRPGTLDAECSLVAAYLAARGKESSGSYSVAMMDFRGYTVIVSYSKSNKEYSLVWAEPVCKNKNRDKYIKTIYLDSDGSTLNLFYYQGKTSFKYKLNLSSKKLTRQR